MKIASFILRTTAVSMAAASVACVVVSYLCSSLRNDEEVNK